MAVAREYGRWRLPATSSDYAACPDSCNNIPVKTSLLICQNVWEIFRNIGGGVTRGETKWYIAIANLGRKNIAGEAAANTSFRLDLLSKIVSVTIPDINIDSDHFKPDGSWFVLTEQLFTCTFASENWKLRDLDFFIDSTRRIEPYRVRITSDDSLALDDDLMNSVIC